MDEIPLDPDLTEQLKKLREKYAVMGQDLSSYLDGLLYSEYLTYWDYIHLDTLLSLQSPRTNFPDEKIFIVYHQITELYFKLVLWEIEQVTHAHDLNAAVFIDKIQRMIRYFRQLIASFDIMIEGMAKDQFLKFRMALLPASGFQSAQYRLIEMASTDLINLVNPDHREHLHNQADVRVLLEKLYWRRGASELLSGKKTLTLQQFEKKYMDTFYEYAVRFREKNIWRIFQSRFGNAPERAHIVPLLRTYDALVNVDWRLVHLKSAGKYLQKDPEAIRATGGTNWQKYLPPRFQQVRFFPELWNEEEQKQWGMAGG